jgi:hypothetical protein
MINDKRQTFLYDADQSSGEQSGGVTAPGSVSSDGAMKQTPKVHEGTTRLRHKPTSSKDVLKDAKLVAKDGRLVDNSQQQIESKAGEDAKKKPEDDILVAGPGSAGETKPDKSTPSGEEPIDGESTQQVEKVKVGDFEYTPEQIQAGQEALTNREKDEQNSKQFFAKLTQKSMLAANFTDDQLKDLLPYATSKRKVPENLKEELQKLEELPKSFKTKDADGYEIDVDIKDIPKETLDAIGNAVLASKVPEFQKMVEENNTLKAENERLKQDQDIQSEAEGTSIAVDFMKQNPEFAITVRKGDNLAKTIADIMGTGGTHHEFENARRFSMLALALDQGFYSSLDEAKSALFNEEKRNKGKQEQIKKNQEQGLEEKPGSARVTSDEGRKLLNRMKARNPKVTKMFKLGRQ